MQQIKLIKCSCGHPSCDYHGFSDGSFPQGSGWDKATATRHLHACNTHDELVAAAQAFIDAFGGNVPDWLRNEAETLTAVLEVASCNS